LRSKKALQALRAARKSRFSSWLRVLGAFILAELSLVQVLPALHHALVHHEVCAEHGELVHAEGSHGHSVTAQKDSPVGGHAGYRADSSSEHQHEHCGLSAAVREPGIAGGEPALALGVQALAPVLSSVAAARAACSIGLLALAPKLPPPSV
jgi:hypothetical protein